MLLVSPLIRAATTILPPRISFQIRLRQMERWRTFEHGWFLIDHLIDPTRVAVDVGANEGLYAGKMVRFTDQVHCFEPIPWFNVKLRATLPKSVIVHPFAVSDTTGPVILRIPYRGGVELHGTSTIENANPLLDAEIVKELDVQGVTLDTAIDRPVGFIKIDVEGHEISVLRGARRIIENDHPIIMIESERRHHPEAPDNIIRFLSERGYVGVSVYANLLYSLANFQIDRHQIDASSRRRYANNFIFFPPMP
jgi:FkbM family methyltransferase